MSINLHAWKKSHPGESVPLAMFGTAAGAYLWAWTSLGAAIEILFQILPVALGFKTTIDAGLARVFFSWTLHAVVYFWLMPTYIAFYTLVPRAIGGRLYSDPMGRLAFILFLVFSMPIGIHHLFQDPQVGSGVKFVHAVFTAMVSVPTLLTVFTIVASVEIAGRLRGGKGALGGSRAALGEPDDAGGRVLVRHARLRRCRRPHQHELPARLRRPQHAVDHGPLPPDLRRRHRDHVLRDRVRPVAAPDRPRARQPAPHACAAVAVVHRHERAHLPWHWVGILGMPRRMAYFDYRTRRFAGGDFGDAELHRRAVLSWSGRCSSSCCARASRGARHAAPFRFSRRCTRRRAVPAVLNGFALWLALMIGFRS
jgi:cytochrome c oxidase subunit 1